MLIQVKLPVANSTFMDSDMPRQRSIFVEVDRKSSDAARTAAFRHVFNRNPTDDYDLYQKTSIVEIVKIK